MATKTTPRKAAKKTTAKAGGASGASKQATTATGLAGTTGKAAHGKPAASSAGARKTSARVPGGSTGVGAKSKAAATSGAVVGKAASKPVSGKSAVKPSPANRITATPRKADPVTADGKAQNAEGSKKVQKSVRPAKKTVSAKPTARQALVKTRKLLKDKQQRDTQTPAWQEINVDPGPAAHRGFQSGEARSKAQELHAGEIRLKPIQGSVSTRDRHNQGKRDKG